MQIIENKVEFRENLLTWYKREKRDLPWRRTSNPYYIWVSEVMLQQTRVDTVIPYYERFIAKYPTMEALAKAEENDLLKMWEGLGYYSRARNLQSGVQEVVESYGSKVPSNRKEISTLKGVGPYTAGAVLSIAFGIPEHAVDGNVMRVISRLVLIEADIAVARNKKIFEDVVMDLIDPLDPSSFNQGLMELGATICTPRPKCLLCPVRTHCSAFHEGKQEELPVKTRKVKKKFIPVASFAIKNEEGKWLLGQRPEKGLLANMWEFPMVELTDDKTPAETFKEQYGVDLTELFDIITFKHVFSHLTWEMNSFRTRLAGTEKVPEGFRFFTKEEVEALPMPVPVLKIWEELKND
ncbi:A/G-specific adenine glycosylase [Sporosarcina sp. G11-34]|uniref:A/G-specific adenine glycosylase n=1 Tax=Sporosarcina sp. G11-34 TaxID=2849605 RepID=UPI0022A99E50|nr:A/G-specific adenine glycosylase [Sporosarcina sp. G11-34]MCZ2260244.1 A/G-specific adenine glycosylase [Sporosarcina sp. G11-34]